MSKTKDDLIESEWLAIQRQLDPGETTADRVLSNMAVMRSGWHRTRNERGQFAYFPDVPVHPGDSPEQRALEDAWEADSIAMHQAQEPLDTLAPKVAEAAGPDSGGRGHFVLKITPNAPDPRIPKFEDSAESAALRRAARTASSATRAPRRGLDTLPSGKREITRS